MPDKATTKNVTMEQLEELGQIAEVADNYVHAAQIPFQLKTHVECLSVGMESLRDRLRVLYVAIAQENPWEE